MNRFLNKFKKLQKNKNITLSKRNESNDKCPHGFSIHEDSKIPYDFNQKKGQFKLCKECLNVDKSKKLRLLYLESVLNLLMIDTSSLKRTPNPKKELLETIDKNNSFISDLLYNLKNLNTNYSKKELHDLNRTISFLTVETPNDIESIINTEDYEIIIKPKKIRIH